MPNGAMKMTDDAMKEQKSESRDKKFNIAKKIVLNKGSDEKYLKQDGALPKRRDGSLEDKEKDESRKGKHEGSLEKKEKDESRKGTRSGSIQYRNM